MDGNDMKDINNECNDDQTTLMVDER